MAYALIDDQYHANPKLLAAGLEAHGLHARAVSYCACYLTDGLVPKAWARANAPKRVLDKLVAHGLLYEHPNAYEVHDYLSYNPTKEDVLKRRAEAADRKRKSRATDNGSHP